MLRRTIIALAAATITALALPAGDADARPLHRGYHGFHARGVVVRPGPVFVRRAAFFPHRRIIVRRAPVFIGTGLYARSCWRLVPTAFGLRRVWVCPRYYAFRRHWASFPYVGIQY